MTQKITISLDEETVQRVRVEAAKAGKSMSRWLADFLEAERAREEALARGGFDPGGLPSELPALADATEQGE